MNLEELTASLIMQEFHSDKFETSPLSDIEWLININFWGLFMVVSISSPT